MDTKLTKSFNKRDDNPALVPGSSVPATVAPEPELIDKLDMPDAAPPAVSGDDWMNRPGEDPWKGMDLSDPQVRLNEYNKLRAAQDKLRSIIGIGTSRDWRYDPDAGRALDESYRLENLFRRHTGCPSPIDYGAEHYMDSIIREASPEYGKSWEFIAGKDRASQKPGDKGLGSMNFLPNSDENSLRWGLTHMNWPGEDDRYEEWRADYSDWLRSIGKDPLWELRDVYHKEKAKSDRWMDINQQIREAKLKALEAQGINRSDQWNRQRKDAQRRGQVEDTLGVSDWDIARLAQQNGQEWLNGMEAARAIAELVNAGALKWDKSLPWQDNFNQSMGTLLPPAGGSSIRRSAGVYEPESISTMIAKSYIRNH